MSVTNPRTEYESLLYVMQRMSFRFPWLDDDELLAATAEEIERFDGVRLRERFRAA